MPEPAILDPELPYKVLYRFPLPTWIENLLTFLTSPELYLLNPSDLKEVVLIHKFEEVLGLTGIIEAKEDDFYVTGGNYNLATFSNESGSHLVWEVDTTNFNTDSKVNIKKIAHLTGAGLLNGI